MIMIFETKKVKLVRIFLYMPFQLGEGKIETKIALRFTQMKIK